MANLVAMNMKRKEHAEVSNYGSSIVLDPKRLKLQDGEIPDMMEEEKAGAPTDATVPTMASSWLLPTQGQEDVHRTLNIPYGIQSLHSKQTKPPPLPPSPPHRWTSRFSSGSGSLRRRRVSRHLSGQVSSDLIPLTAGYLNWRE